MVTCASANEARTIAAALLRKRLVACATVIPGLLSRFRWKGRIETAREVMLLLKTTGKRYRAVERDVKRLHSYEVPEIIALPIIAGSAAYLRWMKSATQKMS